MSGVVCIDGNLLTGSLNNLFNDCYFLDKVVVCEPTSVPKSLSIIRAILSCTKKPKIYITPDESELLVMANEISVDKLDVPLLKDLTVEILNASAKLLTVVDKAIIKLGSKGVLLGQHIDGKHAWTHLKPHKVYDQVVSVTGAGDSLVGALLSGLSRSPNPLDHTQFEDIIRACMKAAELSILTDRAVSEHLNSSIFSEISWINK
jgi:fructose-1-phosphate kinase PfkB-like protein